MASKSLGTLTVDLVAKIGGFVRGLDQAEREAGKRTKAMERRLQELNKSAKAFGAALGTAFVAVGTASAIAIKAAIDNADAIDEMAQRTGIAVETLSRLQVAAKFGAVSLEDLQKSVGRLAVEQQKYAEGNEDTVALFDALGVKAVDAEGKLRSAESVLVDLSDVFETLPDGAQKTALAIDLFGKSGQNLIPFLNQGGEKIAELNEQADRLGITLSSETAKAAGEFNDQVDLGILAVQGLATQVAAELLPDMRDLTAEFTANATEGGKVSQTALEIAEGIRSIVDIAYRGKEAVRTMLAGTMALFDFAAAGAANVGAIVSSSAAKDAEELYRRGQSGLELAGMSRQNAMDGLGLGEKPAVQWIDPPPPEVKEGTDAVTEALRKLYEERRLAADAAKGQAAADKAAADAARELEKADADLARRLEEMAKQQDAFVSGLDALEAQLSGPLAEAELDHANRIKEVQALLDQSVITVEQATRAQILYAESFAKTKDQLDPYGEGLRTLLEDMAFEYDLLGKTNAQRVTELELRRLGIDLSSQEGQAAAEAIKTQAEALEQRQKTINAMDDFRSSFEDNVASVLDGSKSLKDAVRDLLSDLASQFARMIAQNWGAKLFGEMGTDGTGSAGGWLSGLFSAFGGARAAGGPVTAGVPYLVGEQGPELVVPNVSGTVVPAGRTAAMLGGRAGDTYNFNMPGRYDMRTQAQIAADVARIQQKQTARGTA
jgi:hypothetical protein